MGYSFSKDGINTVLNEWAKEYLIYAPTRKVGAGAFSDTDLIRYDKITSADNIEFHEKSDFSFKDILLPISQTLFYFTENEIKVADGPQKGAIIFLRSCDLHAVKRLDEIYLRNGFEDFYYKRIRDHVKFVLIGCKNSFDNCFCVDMNTNKNDSYDASIEPNGDGFIMDNHFDDWSELLLTNCVKTMDVAPSYVTTNEIRVTIPEGLTLAVSKSKMWDEYNSRCINCGRCNFVCPTCTCFSMQDIFYTDNGKAGERRRVMASCMVDGFTDVAGGGAYRKKNGERMRFKVLHKVYDFKKRYGYHMCVGCGRCDDVCPEYISFSNCINKLENAIQEVNQNES
ncbi:MAG: asrA [Anaerocolumna sp.]|jgi:anaerobic sulfite reductase subunit A|nr:asrA [Anaerocolumna sp.]